MCVEPIRATKALAHTILLSDTLQLEVYALYEAIIQFISVV